MARRLPILGVLWWLLTSGLAGADSPAPHPELTPEERAAYGNRADFFRSIPAEFRPDLDWRKALSPSLADREPRWSQGFEELVVRDFFGDRRGGTFVDVGCHLPRRGSTTYDLEERLGWKGLGIDVMPRFRQPWQKLRPRSTFIEAAVADKDGETLQLHVSGAFVSLDEETLEALGQSEPDRVIEVKTATLDTLLEREGIESIDFLSIDIEGAELAALEGFDIQRFQPKLCGIETARREAVTRYFESNGYERIEKYAKADKINLYFRPRTEDRVP